jgi:signal transduction histidine kinase
MILGLIVCIDFVIIRYSEISHKFYMISKDRVGYQKARYLYINRIVFVALSLLCISQQISLSTPKELPISLLMLVPFSAFLIDITRLRLVLIMLVASFVYMFAMLYRENTYCLNLLLKHQLCIRDLLPLYIQSFWLVVVLFVIQARAFNHATVLDTMMQHIPGLMWMTDANLDLLCIKGQGLNFLNLDEGNNLSQTKKMDDNLIELHKTTLTGTQTTCMNESLHPDLGRVILQLKLSPLKNLREEVIGIVGLSQDVTEVVTEKEKRLSSEETYKSLVDTIDETIMKIDSDFKVQFINQEFLGIPRDQYLESNFCDMFQFDTNLQSLVTSRLRKLFETERTVTWDWSIQLTDTEQTVITKHYSSRAIPVHASDRQIIAATIVTSDTTEYIRAREQEKLANEMKIASRCKSEFLASMSHEIRNPLNGILGSLQLLGCCDPLSDIQAEHIKDANENVKLLLAILSDVLDMSKIESGRLEIMREESSLLDIVETVGTMIAPQAHEKNLSVHTFIDCKIPELFYCDRHRISQILLNYASNAIKFTSTGYIKLSAKLIEDFPDSSEIYFECKDTGIGIHDRDKENIFQPYVQVVKKNEEQKGWGLGLQICYRLAVLMSGTVGVESECDFGSTFYFKVRLQKAIQQDTANPTEDVPQTRKIIDTLVEPDYKTVYILEKDPILVSVLENYLNMLKVETILKSSEFSDLQDYLHSARKRTRIAIISGAEYENQVVMYASKYCKIVLLAKEYPRYAQTQQYKVILRMPVKLSKLVAALQKQADIVDDESSPEVSPITTSVSSVSWPDLSKEGARFYELLDILGKVFHLPKYFNIILNNS